MNGNCRSTAPLTTRSKKNKRYPICHTANGTGIGNAGAGSTGHSMLLGHIPGSRNDDSARAKTSGGYTIWNTGAATAKTSTSRRAESRDKDPVVTT